MDGSKLVQKLKKVAIKIDANSSKSRNQNGCKTIVNVTLKIGTSTYNGHNQNL